MRIEHIEVEPDPAFQIGQLVERFLEQLGIDIAALGDEHEADLLVALVTDILEDRQLAIGDQLGDLLDQLALRQHVGNLGDDQLPLPAAQLLDPGLFPVALFVAPGGEAAAQPDRALAAGIGRADRRRTVDREAAGGEIRAVEHFHQLGMLRMGIVDQQQRRIDDLGHVVAGDRGRHAHRDPGRAIGQQVGEQAGEDFRLFLLAIVGRYEIDRALVEPGHQADRRPGQAGFGVAVGGRVIAVDVAEVALAFDQRVTQRPVLGEPDHRIVDRGIAMRVILADHVADDAGRLLEAAGGVELELAHRPQQAAVDRLQAIAQVRQRTGRDRRKRIDEVSLGQRTVERRIDNRVERILIFGRGLRHRDADVASRRGNRNRRSDPIPGLFQPIHSRFHATTVVRPGRAPARPAIITALRCIALCPAPPGARHQELAADSFDEVLEKVELSCEPRPDTVVITATAIRAAISPYSMAVAPASSASNLRKMVMSGPRRHGG